MRAAVLPVLLVVVVGAGVWQLLEGHSDAGYTILLWGIGAVYTAVCGPAILAGLRAPSAQEEATWREVSLATPPSPLRELRRHEAAPIRNLYGGVTVAMLPAIFVLWAITIPDDFPALPVYGALIVALCGLALGFRGHSQMSKGLTRSRAYEELGLTAEAPADRYVLRAHGTRHGRQVDMEVTPNLMRIEIDCPDEPSTLPENARHEEGRLIIEREGKQAALQFLPDLLAAERACQARAPHISASK